MNRRIKHTIAGATLAAASLIPSAAHAEPVEDVAHAAQAVEQEQSFDLAEISKELLDAMQGLGFASLAAAGLFVGWQATEKNRSAVGLRTKLALEGYESNNKGLGRKVLAGSLLPAAAASVIAASFAIEQEVREGPNRVIDSISDIADEDLHWVLESGTDHFMNTSELPGAEFSEIMSIVDEDSIPFGYDFSEIAGANGSSQTGLIFSLPLSSLSTEFELSDSALEELESDPSTPIAIVDQNSNHKVGDSLTIRDRVYTVGGYSSEPNSLLNRSVVITNLQANDRVSGMLLSESSADSLRDVADDIGVDVFSTEQIKEQNEEFWEGNVSALMMVLMTTGLALGAAAIYGHESTKNRMNRELIGGLRGIGMGIDDIAKIHGTRGIAQSVKGGVLGGASAYALVEITNRGITGFNGELNVRNVAATTGVLLFADTVSAAMLVNKTRKESPVDQMKAN